ncbi:hypothetical protein CAPTEDRAFT_191293 [Capitella teleta]|uniref:Uncharacterized protein n=1 Tax=Capitella teleta TaxID=283909 RepID=R7U7C4_CAPTE|nr:hypothetical protein CAPTEDRAFT_191293 [Capitella teleta]|eukprot:ELU01869.1 hypothetical protein CAPTEDRAFT_191293 [Capitella teleta]
MTTSFFLLVLLVLGSNAVQFRLMFRNHKSDSSSPNENAKKTTPNDEAMIKRIQAVDQFDHVTHYKRKVEPPNKVKMLVTIEALDPKYKSRLGFLDNRKATSAFVTQRLKRDTREMSVQIDLAILQNMTNAKRTEFFKSPFSRMSKLYRIG